MYVLVNSFILLNKNSVCYQRKKDLLSVGFQMHPGLFQDLGKQESEFLSTCNVERIKLQDEIIELEGRLTGDHDCSSFLDSLDNLISGSQGELNSVKKVIFFLPKVFFLLCSPFYA